MLQLINSKSRLELIPHSVSPEAFDHHHGLLESYFQSHRIRNHSEKTIRKERAFLFGWFEEYGSPSRPLYTWEAMTPQSGRERLVQYGKALLASQLSSDTIRSYLGILRNYFAYILEHPFVKTPSGFTRIQNYYGPIEQPISEYDIPTHTYEGERKGVPFDPERLYEFYSVVRKNYLESTGHFQAIAARNYTALVLGGESGLRADELLHLEVQDLHFDSLKIQTRFAKGTRGSGKRARLTLFTPLAQDTARFYLNRFRPKIQGSDQSTYLFPSKTGGLLDYSNLQQGLTEMLQSARKSGFVVESHMSWHWMRRLFATRFEENNRKYWDYYLSSKSQDLSQRKS